MKVIVFTPHGAVQLLASKAKNAEVIWASDDDEDFAEEFDDVLDPNSDDDVNSLTDYLIEHEHIDEGEDMMIEEQYLDGPGDEEDDEDDDGDYFDPNGRLGYVDG
jgi:hypothetical protein